MPGNIGVFVAGQQIVRPSAFTQINTSAMVPVTSGSSQAAGIIGAFDGGLANTVLTFTSFAQAQAVLRGGQAMSYLSRIFNPGGGNPGASKVYVVRAGAPAPSTLASTCGLTFTSIDAGSHNNGIIITVAVGSTTPWAVTVAKSADNYTRTYNVGNALMVTAPVSGTNKITFDHTNMVATISDIAGSNTMSYPNDGFTIATLIPWINARAGWSSVLAVGSDPSMPIRYMDNPAGGQTLTNNVATSLPASQGMACYEISLNDTYVDAALTAGSTYAALTAAAATSMAAGTGSSLDALTLAHYNTALAVMDTVDPAALFMAWQAGQTATPSQVQAAAYADCVTQRSVTRKRYRILYTGFGPVGGTAEATSVAAAVAAAPTMAGPVVFAWNGVATPNPISGLTEQLGGLGTAAQLCGLACGAGPATPLTNMALTSYGLEYSNPTDADINALLMAGITPIATDPTTGNAIVVQAITTYQGGANVSWRTLTGLRVQDAITRLFNSVLSPFVGYPLDLMTGELIRSSAAKALDGSVVTAQNPSGFLTPGYVAGKQVPAWSNLSVTTDGLQSWNIFVQAHPVCESDYISVMVNLTPVPISL